MKYKFVLATIVAVLLVGAVDAADPVIHKFQLWGGLTDTDKLAFYLGFTNGLVEGGRPHKMHEDAATQGHQLLDCLLDSSSSPTTLQAIAMIDKYYRGHPEKWSDLVGQAIFDALMVKGGPCVANQ